MRKPTENWILDAVLFVALLVALLKDWTGFALHQWLGLGLAILAACHLGLHWAWARAATRTLFGKQPRRVRLSHALDGALLAGLICTLASGLVMSTWLGLPLANSLAWERAHIAASLATLLLAVAKVALHWRWVITVSRRLRPQPRLPQALPAQLPLIPVRAAPSRRDFLRLISIVGVASVVAALPALQEVQAQGGRNAEASASEQRTTFIPVRSASLSGAPCSKGCSFPGGCRRYTDADGNDLCDLGQRTT